MFIVVIYKCTSKCITVQSSTAKCSPVHLTGLSDPTVQNQHSQLAFIDRGKKITSQRYFEPCMEADCQIVRLSDNSDTSCWQPIARPLGHYWANCFLFIQFYKNHILYKTRDFPCCVVFPVCVRLVLPPLVSETVRTRDLWFNSVLLILENYDNF